MAVSYFITPAQAARGSHALLAAQIRAGQVFPEAMKRWTDRHGDPVAPAAKVKVQTSFAKRGRKPAQPKPNRPDFILILNHVSEREDVLVEDIIGVSRHRKAVKARRRAARLLRRLGFSLPAIGFALHRDHSSALNLIRPKVRGATRK